MIRNLRRAAVGDSAAASSLNIIAGVWLILSPFIFRFWDLGPPMWNSIAVGVAVVILAAIRSAAPLQNVMLSWLNFLLGIWLTASPWVLGYSLLYRLVWNDVVLGILIAALSLWSALTVPRTAKALR